MPRRPPKDEGPREQDDGEEGTLSRENLEARNAERADGIVIIAEEESEVTVYNSSLGALIDRHYDEMRNLSTRVIVIAVLVVTGLALWRIGTLGRLLGWL